MKSNSNDTHIGSYVWKAIDQENHTYPMRDKVEDKDEQDRMCGIS
jgi:hypothetical protein